jgi:hypothetical protein
MVEIQGNMPKNPQQMQAEQDAAVTESLDIIKNKILVMSGKGGVGKTSTSVNLSIALANKGYKVGIIDVDLHGPDVPRMLGLEGTPEVNQNRKLNPLSYSDNLKAISIESFTPNKDDAIIWRGPLKFSAIKQFIGEVEWKDLDFLIIDSALNGGPNHHRCQGCHCYHPPGSGVGGCAQIHKFLQNRQYGDFRIAGKHERFFLSPLQRDDQPFRVRRWRKNSCSNGYPFFGKNSL